MTQSGQRPGTNNDQAPFKFNGKFLGAQVKYLGKDAKLNGKEEREIERPIPVAD